jgi:hypothetical protein
MRFVVVIDPLAIRDIQETINYYDEQSNGLGKRFESVLNSHFSTLKKILSYEFDMTKFVV